MFESVVEPVLDSRLFDDDWPDDPIVDILFDDLVENCPSVDDPAVGPPTPGLPKAEDIAPSGMFALELDWATSHPDTMSAAELVDAAVGFEKVAAWAMARQQQVLAAFGRRPEDGSIRPATPGLGGADTRAWADDEIGLALTLAPGAAATLCPGCDGMATLSAYLTATEATACFEWITRLARGLPCVPGPEGSTKKRSMDLRRADVVHALLTGRLITANPEAGAESASADTTSATACGTDDNPLLLAAPVSAHRPLIHVTVPITTLMGIDDEPGELAGYGPVPGAIARQIAGDPNSTWRRLLTDPASGTLLDYGRTTYRPPAALAGFVRARDAHCRFPGCRRPAISCELDHVQPWALDGATSEDNLCALCIRHHDLKEQIGWRVVLHADRRMEWITPTGHHYWSRPVDHRPPLPPRSTPDPPAEPRKLPLPRRTFEELWTLGSPDAGDPPPF